MDSKRKRAREQFLHKCAPDSVRSCKCKCKCKKRRREKKTMWLDFILFWGVSARWMFCLCFNAFKKQLIWRNSSFFCMQFLGNYLRQSRFQCNFNGTHFSWLSELIHIFYWEDYLERFKEWLIWSMNLRLTLKRMIKFRQNIDWLIGHVHSIDKNLY